MRTRSLPAFLFFASLSLLSVTGCGSEDEAQTTGAENVYPGENWAEALPENLGLDPERLMALEHFFDPLRSSSLLVVRKGYLVWERYWEPNAKETPFEVWSVAKSFTSALAGIAVGDGSLEVQQPASDFVDEWAPPDPRSAITIEHLLSMTSGLQWSYLEYVPIGMLLFHLGSGDFLELALDRPLEYQPGTRWTYSNLAVMALSGILSRAVGMDLREFARQRLAGPIGMRSFDWRTDLEGHALTFGGLIGTARDLARFGYLFLRQGSWENGQVVPEHWADLSTRASSALNPAYGYLWWINGTAESWSMEGIPSYHVPANGPYFGEAASADTFAATGAFGQLILVVPEHELVMVHTGANDHFDYRDAVALLCAAVK